MTGPAVAAWIGIGSNLDDPDVQVAKALRDIDEIPATRLMRCSSFYETEPVGMRDQPCFVNAVALVETRRGARELLDALLDIERRHGRVRAEKNGPRILDLDLLLYGDLRVDEAGLCLPHPRMHERAFVLAPLLEIDPDVEVPGRGRAAQFLASTHAQGVKKR